MKCSTSLLVVLASCLVISNSVQATERQLQTASQVSRMQIDGWWASCGRLNKKCEGGFKEHGPEAIDTTGETCYINPLRRNKGVVQWIAPLGNETALDDQDATIYVYAVIFPANLSDTYFPTNCTDAGACSCDSIEPLRAGWKQSPTSCGADAISCHIFPTYLEPGRACNVNEYITYKDPNDGTQSFCSWTVSLAATSAATSTRMTMVVGATVASLSLVWALVM